MHALPLPCGIVVGLDDVCVRFVEAKRSLPREELGPLLLPLASENLRILKII